MPGRCKGSGQQILGPQLHAVARLCATRAIYGLWWMGFGIQQRRREVTVALVAPEFFMYALVQAFGERFDWFALNGS